MQRQPLWPQVGAEVEGVPVAVPVPVAVAVAANTTANKILLP